jgi:hypothetical protein
LPVGGDDFSDWLVHRYYNELRKAPRDAALRTALRTLTAQAKFDGDRRNVYLRSARIDGIIYIDIGDEEHNVVEVTSKGWRIIQDAPVRFRRSQGFAPLPLPEPGGSIDLLRDLVNLNEHGFTLFVAWLLDALYPDHPHPVLYLVGEEGSAKTTAVKIARSLTDPDGVPLRNLPTTVRDLFTGAADCGVLAYDNVGTIGPGISDALCQIVSGSGFSTRKLYSDTAQVVIGGYRAVILNGLQNGITQSDLADRSIVVPMVRISSDQRRLDSQIWPQFETRRGRIFGALLDGVSCGLRNLDSVELQRLPRMADFARWVVATAAFPDGAFLRAFESAQTEATEAVAENNPVIIAIVAFMEGYDEWHGTAVQLIAELSTKDKAEAKPTKWRSWPANASAFGRKLSDATATLRKLGIVVIKGRARDRKSSRLISLKKMVSDVSAVSGTDATDSTDGSDSTSKTIERMAA